MNACNVFCSRTILAFNFSNPKNQQCLYYLSFDLNGCILGLEFTSLLTVSIFLEGSANTFFYKTALT